MSKYHINPATGNAGVCKARSGNCRFGADDAHYNSAKDAQRAYELQQELASIPTVAKKTQQELDQEESRRQARCLATMEKRYATVGKVRSDFDSQRKIEQALEKELSLLKKNSREADWRLTSSWKSDKERELEASAGHLRSARKFSPESYQRALDNYEDCLVRDTKAEVVAYLSDARLARTANDMDSKVEQRKIHLDAVKSIGEARSNEALRKDLESTFRFKSDEVNYVLDNAQDWFMGKKNSTRTLEAMAANPMRFSVFKNMRVMKEKEISTILSFASKYSAYSKS